MTNEQKHEGAYEAVLSNLNHFALPETQNLKSKVERGECLNEFELEHLKNLIDMASKLKQIQTMDERNKELSESFISLLTGISKHALLNEQRNSRPH